MSRDEAIGLLRLAGWTIDRPELIEIVRADETGAVLYQAGNGTWYVGIGGSVSFVED